MEQLYILGNGFDRYHGLKTQWQDFHKYLTENNPELSYDLEEFFQLGCDEKYYWANFEKDLATFQDGSFFDDHNRTNPLSETFKLSECYGLEDDITHSAEELCREISSSLNDWIETIDNDLDAGFDTSIKKLPINADSFVINFNYTSTLSVIYNLDKNKILFIHGNNRELTDLVIGHNVSRDRSPELDKDGESTRTMFSDSEAAAKIPLHSFLKPVPEIIETNNIFFSKLHSVSEVFVFGHSLNDIDRPYFEKIKNSVKPRAKWEISYHDPNERHTRVKKIEALGITNFSLFEF